MSAISYVYLYVIVINSSVVHSSSSASPKGLFKQHTPPPIGLRLSKNALVRPLRYVEARLHPCGFEELGVSPAARVRGATVAPL